MAVKRNPTRWMGALALVLSAAVAACGSTNATTSPKPTFAPTPSATPSAATASPTAIASPTTSPTASPSPTPGTGLPNFSHVYLIVMENKEYGSIVGSSAAPYINELIARYGSATNLYAETHPSEPNYIALTSGGLQGTSSDGTYDLSVPNLFDQVEGSGRTWHVYAQGYPGECYRGSSAAAVVDGTGAAGEYARKHNPAISYTTISRNATSCANITKLAGFDPAAADFEMIIPNQINDMHSSSVAAGDSFLKAFVPQIVNSPAFAGSVLFITWDEGSSSVKGGGHIATVVVSPGMTPGSRFTGAASHYSMLRTIELAWGLPLLGAAATATTIALPY
ncbi:MAG: alkaline phosphatase family protein [Candidatus Limnocylindrales bacterium]